jgi:hypothetical protein
MRGGGLCQTSCNSLKYLILVTGIYASSWSHGPPAIQTFSSLEERTDSHAMISVLVRCLKLRVRTINPASSFCALTLRNGGVRPAPTPKLEPGISFFH